VEGTIAVEATLEDRTATVVFDDDVTSLEAILRATANIGYESLPL
jgi:copper chaperone CopZ